MRGVWLALMAAGMILWLAGPFGIGDALRPVPRLAYWLAVVWGGVSVGLALNLLAARLLPGAPSPTARAAAGLATALVVTAALLAFDGTVLDARPVTPAHAARFLALASGIALVLSLALPVLARRAGPAPAGAAAEPPKLLQRLPPDRRGDLVSVSASGRFVEIQTTRGMTLLMLDFEQALSELADGGGVRVHDRQWVALGHVAELRRNGTQMHLVLTDGRDIPVGPTYLPGLHAAGFPPATGGQDG